MALGSVVVPAAFHAPWWAFAAAWLAGVIWYAAAVAVTNRGWWWLTGLLAFLGTYGAWALGRCVIDQRTLDQAFSPDTQSWALLWDIVMAAATMPAARLFHQRRQFHSFNQRFGPGWAGKAYLLGLVLTLAIQAFTDVPNYLHAGAAVLLFDPAKIIHGLFIFPFMAGLLIYVGWPLISSRRYWSYRSYGRQALVPVVLVVVVLGWIALANTHDAGRGPGAPLDLFRIQTAFDWERMQPVPNYRPAVSGLHDHGNGPGAP